jgi:uncharacterized repeat protein (TIGR02543 family)
MLQDPAVTLIATWKERSYDVHLDFNGGYIVENGEEISRKNASATFGKPTDFPVPSKRGYDFVGWYYGEQEVSTSSWNLDVGTVIIKAVWDYKTYGVTFDFNGGNRRSLDRGKEHTTKRIANRPRVTGFEGLRCKMRVRSGFGRLVHLDILRHFESAQTNRHMLPPLKD